MKMIVGLGNPGDKYCSTRHNVGFMAIDRYLSKKVNYKTKFNGEYFVDSTNDVIFVKPLSFMNLSGEVIKQFKNYYNIDTGDILIIYDDMAFELGNVKIKPDGSAGGHNGFKNIIDNLNNSNIKRIRIGIGKPKYDMKNYVLSKFSDNEKDVLDEVLDKVVDIVNDYLRMDFDKLMNKYN